jgi:hypothetical protein
VIAAHHLGALLPVGLLDRLLDLGDGLVPGEHPGEGEEARLHDRVDAPTHPRRLRDLDRVDDVELQLLLQHRLLELAGELVPELVRRVRGVDQHHRAGGGELEQVQPVDQRELVHSDKAGLLHQV